jgi:hypothetical protein
MPPESRDGSKQILARNTAYSVCASRAAASLMTELLQLPLDTVGLL